MRPEAKQAASKARSGCGWERMRAQNEASTSAADVAEPWMADFGFEILRGRAMGVVEIVPKSGVFDYTSKYTKGLTEYVLIVCFDCMF